ncbi:hypothetical protein [Flavobacterium sp.]|uniref:hypothetical protein n=1 Tax=Flavobacterium sp. TaxID=239 RepID=UPI002FDA3A7A
MIVIVFKYLIPKGYRGFTFYPFVFLKYPSDINDAVLLNHEKIHLRQQKELLLVFFLLWYFLEFVFRFIQHQNINKAYHALSFEKEAYQNEKDLMYLKGRKFGEFLNYFNT